MKRVLVILRRILLAMGITIGSIAVLSLMLLFVAGLMIKTGFEGSGELPAECGIVFGAAVYGYETPSPAIVRRVSGAAEFYREGRLERLILTGGKGESGKRSEADVMRDEAIAQGVLRSDIIIEPNAHSTWENIRYTRNLTNDCSSVIAISDAFHLARIRLLARRQGWEELETVPIPIRPGESAERKSLIREMFAYVYYALRLDRLPLLRNIPSANSIGTTEHLRTQIALEAWKSL